MNPTDSSLGIARSRTEYYDPNLLDWVRGTQPTIVTDTVTIAGSVAVSNMIAAVETGLAKDATLTGGTVKANPTTGEGHTLLYVAIAQGAAGTTQLVAADATKKIKVVSYVLVMSLGGSAKFLDSAADLTGAMVLVTSGGVSAISRASSPLFETGVNKALSITTVTGAAQGHLSYFLEA